MNIHKHLGFTILELLIVVTIIGVLATIVLTSLGSSRDKAREARAYIELNQLRSTVAGAQINVSQTLLAMNSPAGNGTFDSCPTSTNLASLSSSHACVADWRAAIDTIIANHEPSQDSSAFYEDAWGSPYLLDENEDEIPANRCRRDTITSVGSDKIAFTADDITVVLTFESCS